ncbi:MAG: twin-arginine translocase TatA/TatE family subunit, partial [Pirellulales bacterium]
LFAFSLGMQEMIIIGIIGVLLFGKRLPEVGKSLGKTFGEFKRGMQGIQSEVSTAVNTSDHSSSYSPSTYDESVDDYEEVTAPKFEPPSSEPTEEKPEDSSGSDS